MMVIAATQTPASWPLWLGGALSFVALILAVAYLFSYGLRRTLRRGESQPSE